MCNHIEAQIFHGQASVQMHVLMGGAVPTDIISRQGLAEESSLCSRPGNSFCKSVDTSCMLLLANGLPQSARKEGQAMCHCALCGEDPRRNLSLIYEKDTK